MTGAAKAALDRGVACHQAGDLRQAESIYRDVAVQVPGHPDVHHLLGLCLHQQGRSEQARLEIEAAIAARGTVSHYHNSLGEVLRASGDVPGAIASYRRALELAPGNLQACNNLGMALHASGDAAAAKEAFRRVLDAHPDAAEAHNNVGIAEQSLGELDAAIASFRRATELAPEHAEAWNNLGAALELAGELPAATEALERAVSVAPGSARAHYNLARARVADGRAEEALASARRALELAPGEADFHLQLAYVLRALGRQSESREALRAALERDPGHAMAHNDLGVSLLMEGEFESAEQHLRAAVESAPRLGVAYHNLAQTRRYDDADAALMECMASALADPRASDADRTHLHFALGKMWDDRGDAARAFPHLETGNALVHARRPWDPRARSEHVDRLIEVFDATWFGERAGLEYGHPSTAPIFIVGMLRSGTTLVEQILATHSKVRARGELDFFSSLAEIMPERLGTPEVPYPSCARGLSPRDLDGIATSYLDQAFGEPDGAERFTDKNPLNFDHLGLIAVMFPNARLVHVRRDPMDTCLSVFSTHFARDNPFAYDLGDIAAYYRDYLRLMEHWRACLGSRLYEVVYESLVSEQESCTRDLLAQCALEWEPQCLDFHATRRPVGTASQWQVRQPLYSRAVGRWQRYADGLSPLRDALAE